jgi:K+-sensing histidine kinase KdpD
MENLFALRELASREALRARHRERTTSPFERLLLAIGSRPVDLAIIGRAGRIAARLAIEFAIAHVVEPRQLADPALVEAMRTEARKTNVEWIEEIADDIPRRVIELARSHPETTVALAATNRAPRWMSRPSFARRLLDAGARELLVLLPPAEFGVERKVELEDVDARLA